MDYNKINLLNTNTCNKINYSIDYINIDSSKRIQNNKITESENIKLELNPLSFINNKLKINIINNNYFEKGDGIIIEGVQDRKIILNTIIKEKNRKKESLVFYEGKKYLKIISENNFEYENDILEMTYNNIQININGLLGDIKKQYLFNLINYIWNFKKINNNKFVLTILEDVFGTNKNTINTNPKHLNMKIANIYINKYGFVTGHVHQVIKNENLIWIDNKLNYQNIPNEYYYESQNLINNINKNLFFPINIYDYMFYLEKIQNIIRPIFFNYMKNNINFINKYKFNNKKYILNIKILYKKIIYNTDMIGNIPITNINKTSNMIFLNEKIKKNKFYIKLDKKFKYSQFEYFNQYNSGYLMFNIFEKKQSYITLKINHYGGILINSINNNSLNIFPNIKYINRVSKKYITVQLDKQGFYNKNFGGDNIYITIVKNFFYGYQNPNKYIYNLNKTYTNIIYFEIISSIFPKTHTNISKNKKNNKFYWQNLDEGGKIHIIELEYYNYSILEMIKIMEKKISLIPRKDKNMNHIKININESTNTIIFRNYTCHLLKNPFIKIYSINNININNKDSENKYYQYPNGYFKNNNIFLTSNLFRIKINHLNHNLNINNEIIIDESIEIYGFFKDDINRKHKITQIIDKNNYDIVINVKYDPKYELHNNIQNYFVKIYTKNKFRILFNKKDTFGSILGFKNVGNINSITKYSNIIKNIDPYHGEIVNENINQNIINFEDDYLLIYCKELKNFDFNKKKYFYKINLNGNYNEKLYNTYVHTPLIFQKPLKDLSQLSLEFHTSSGELYNFNNKNHSFVLKIITKNQ